MGCINLTTLWLPEISVFLCCQKLKQRFLLWNEVCKLHFKSKSSTTTPCSASMPKYAVCSISMGANCFFLGVLAFSVEIALTLTGLSSAAGVANGSGHHYISLGWNGAWWCRTAHGHWALTCRCSWVCSVTTAEHSWIQCGPHFKFNWIVQKQPLGTNNDLMWRKGKCVCLA